MNPIPPLSVVRLKSADTGWSDIAGRTFRIGYYSPNDGLECVWLVDESGKYMRTADQQDIVDDFEVLYLSNESEMFGVGRPIIGALKGSE